MSQVIQVACGGNHTLSLLADGTVYAWGDNRFGQIGIGKSATYFNQPERINSLTGIPFKQIVAGGGHSFALSVSGAVFAWGRNSNGQLGIGDTDDKCYPVHVKSLRSQRVVHIACGEEFTAALTKDGRLFTFGSGAFGQLGHGSTNSETLPKQIFELMGSKVVNVACGRGHTLVVVNDKLYSFGLAGSGQLGLNDLTRRNRLTPMVVRTTFKIKRVFAGADQSFALCVSEPSPEQSSLPQPVPRVPKHLTTDWINQLMKNPSALIEDLELIFSNPACINCSFLKRNDEHYGTGSKNCGVDMDAAMEGFDMLNSSSADQIIRAIKRAVSNHLFPQLTARPPDVEALRLYAILPWCPIFNKPESFETLHYPFAQRLNALEKISWTIIESWWRSFSARHLNRVLKIFKQVVSTVLDLPTIQSSNMFQRNTEIASRNEMIKACLDVLSRLNKVNMKLRKLSFDAFYINELETKMDVRSEYCRWMMNRNSDEFTIFNYPFIFNAAVKTMLLQTDAALQMHVLLSETTRTNFEALFNPFQPMVNPYFVLHVSRSNIVEDTLTQLLTSTTPYELKKPLKVMQHISLTYALLGVKFEGEDAVDEGGVKKEFFLILFQELLHPKYGMFVEDPESRLLWFANYPFEEPTMFQLVGILAGLAVYNSVLVPLPFPLALYKKLLGHSVTLDDFKELCPTEGRSLENLLDYEEDDFEDTFSLNFTVNVSVYGHVKSDNLKPGGDNLPVTRENRQEYVDLYVDHKLNKQTKVPFEAFARGILSVMPTHIMKFFQPQELMELVAGNEHFDWTEFENNAAYHGEYWRKHPTIQMFWEVFHSLADEQKKKFLLFLTGNARVPLLGMKELKINIQPTGGADAYFPVAHTCFNLLDLPKYTKADILRKRLLESIEHTQGFSLA